MTKEQHDLTRILTLRDEFKRRDTHVVAAVIAKGISRRFPRKNVAPICGRPLVEWSLVQALCSHLVTETYLSTDDEEIASIGRRLGVPVIWRYELGEGVAGNVALSHAIHQVREWHPIDIFLGFLPTNPLKQPWDIDECTWRYWDMRKRHRDCRVVNPLASQLETVIHKRLDDERSVTIVGDKHSHYMDGTATCWSTSDPDWYLWMTGMCARTDAEVVDLEVKLDGHPAPLTENVNYYYQVEHFQRFDLDLPEQRSVIESIMEKHILCEGPDVYERYKAQGQKGTT